MKICVAHPLRGSMALCGDVDPAQEIHPLGAQATCEECRAIITKILNAYRRKAKRK